MTDYSSIVPEEPMLAWSDHHSSETWRLELDANGAASIYLRYRHSGDNSIGMDERHRCVLAWSIHGSVIDRDALRADLADGGRLATLLDRVHAGHEVRWDGSNYRGYLNDDARDADDELERLLSGYDGYGYQSSDESLWDAYEWLSAGGSNDVGWMLAELGITADTDPDSDDAKQAASDMEGWAIADGCHLIDADGAIRHLLERAREEAAA